MAVSDLNPSFLAVLITQQSYFNILYKEDSTEGNVDLIEGNNDVGSSLDR